MTHCMRAASPVQRSPLEHTLTYPGARAQGRMKRLEGVRLEVDSRRHTVAALGAKIEGQRARLPQTRSKGEFQMEQTIRKMQHKENKLAGARARAPPARRFAPPPPLSTQNGGASLPHARNQSFGGAAYVPPVQNGGSASPGEAAARQRLQEQRGPGRRGADAARGAGARAATRQSFKEQEGLVNQQLAQLIRDGVWLKSYLAAVMRLEAEAFQQARPSNTEVICVAAELVGRQPARPVRVAAGGQARAALWSPAEQAVGHRADAAAGLVCAFSDRTPLHRPRACSAFPPPSARDDLWHKKSARWRASAERPGRATAGPTAACLYQTTAAV